MNYKIHTKITNIRGDVLYEKTTPMKFLDNILNTDLAIIYAESQQNELEKGLDIPDQEDSKFLTHLDN